MKTDETKNVVKTVGPSEAWFRRGQAFASAMVKVQRKPGVFQQLKGHHLCRCGSGKKFRDCCRAVELPADVRII